MVIQQRVPLVKGASLLGISRFERESAFRGGVVVVRG